MSFPILRKTLLISLCFFNIFLFFIQASISAEKTHVVITQVAEGPLIEKAISILEEAYSKLGYTVEFKSLQDELALKKSNKGEMDGEMVRVVGIEKKYPNLIPIRVPYLIAENLLFAREDWSKKINEWDDLIPIVKDKGDIGLRAGLKKGEHELNSRNIPFTIFNTNKDALKMLSQGKIDLVYEERLTGAAILKKLGIKNVKVIDPPLDSVALYHYVHKSNRHIVPKLEQAFREIIHGLPEKEEKKVSLTPEERIWLKNHQVIRLGVDADYAPYSFRDEQGKYRGIAMEYSDYMSKQLGITMEVVADLSWPQIVEGVRQKNLDVVLTMSHRPDRDVFVNFTEIYLPTPLVIMRRSGDVSIQSESDLDGRLVAMVEGYGSSKRIMEDHPTVKPLMVKTALDGLFAVVTGKADAYVGVLGINLYLTKEFGITNLEVAGLYGEGTNGQRFGVRKDWPELAVILDKALKAIPETDKRNLFDRWLPSSAVVTNLSKQKQAAKQIHLSPDEQTWLKNHPVIEIGLMDAWPPMDYVDKNGNAIGIGAQFIHAINQQLGNVLKIKSAPWKEIYEGVKEKRLAGLMGITPRPDREAYFNFTTPYVTIPHTIISRRGSPYANTIADLNGKKVVVEEGFFISKVLAEKYPGVAVLEYPNTSAALDAVSKGVADAYIGNRAVALYLIEQELFSNLVFQGTIKETASVNAIGIRKDWPILCNILQKALDNIPSEGRRNILSHWTSPQDKSTKQTQKFNLTPQERAWLKQHPTIKVHNEMDWPPYNYNKAGKPLGYSIDIMNKVAEMVGLKIEFVFGPSWDDFLKMVKNNEIDVMLNITKNKEREEYLEFTSPYFTLSRRIVHKNENGPYNHIAELNGKKMAAVEGFFIASFIKKTYPEIELVLFPDTLSALLATARGDIVAFVDESAVLNHLINEHRITDLRISPPMDREEFPTADLHFGVRKDWKILADIFNKALTEITQQDRSRLSQKWLSPQKNPVLVPKKDQGTWWLMAGAVTIFLVLLIGALYLTRIFSDESLIRQFGSFRFRVIALVSMSLIAVMVGMMVRYAMEKNKKFTLDTVGAELKVVLQNTMAQNDLWVQERLILLSQLGRDQELVAITKRLLKVRPEADALKTSSPLAEVRAFVEAREKEFGKIGVFIINPDNISIGSMRDENIGTKNLIAIKKPDLLAQVFQGTPMFIPPILSDVDFQVNDTKTVRSNQKPLSLFFAAPIRDVDGRVIAVLAQRLQPHGQMSKIMNNGRIGKSGECYMINLKGQMITKSRFQNQLYDIGLLDRKGPSSQFIEVRDPGVNLLNGLQSSIPHSKQPFTRMAEDLIRLNHEIKETGSLTDHSEIVLDVKGYRDYRGIIVLGAWMWEPHLGLGIATKIDKKEALSGYHTLRLNLLITAGAALLLAILATLITIMLGERATRVMRRTQKELEDLVDDRTRELLESEIRIRTIVDNLMDGIVTIDESGRVDFFSPGAEEIFGYKAQEVQGKNVKILMPEPYHSNHDQYLHNYIKTGHKKIIGISQEVKGRRKDGSTFPLSIGINEHLSGEKKMFTAIIRDITAAKLDEKTLQENKERLELALKGGNLGFWDVNFKTGETFYNDRHAEILGYDIDALPKTRSFWIQSLHPDDKNRVLKVGKAYREGALSDYEIEYRTITKEGKIIWISSIGVAVERDQNGHALRMVGTSMDITDRKTAEQGLRKLNRAVEDNPLAIIITDRQGIIEYVNPKFTDMTGYDPDDAIGKNPNILNSGLHPPEFFKELWDTVLAGKEWHGEIQNRRKNDKLQWQSAIIAPILDEKQEITHFVSIQEDVTEKKMAAEELKKLSRAIEQSPVSVVITNPEGTIEYVNPIFCKVTGYNLEEAIGQNPRILKSGMHPPEFYKDMWETITSGNTWTGELSNKKKNDEIYWESASISPVRDLQGDITHYVAVKEDITQSKLMKEELIKAKQKAEEATIAKSDFLANMSHEIRTPMNAIVGMSYLALETELTQRQHDYLNKIDMSAKSLLAIINDILDFSKIEAGKLSIEITEFNLNEILEDVVTLSMEKISQKGVELFFNVDRNVPTVLLGDPVRISQIFNNLLSNAAKFTERGEIELTAMVTEKMTNELILECTISDTGIGMTEKQAGKLFQKFSQADTSTTRKYGGTGLGLAIARQLVTLMGGDIQVQSSPDEGTTFYFTVRTGYREDRRKKKQERTLPVDLRNKFVLLVSGNIWILKKLTQLLESLSFTVEAISNIDQVEIKNKTYDLAMVDYSMAPAFFDRTELSDVAVIIISSITQIRHAEMMIREKKHANVMQKPIHPSSVFNAVVDLFGYRDFRIERRKILRSEIANDYSKIKGAKVLLVEDNAMNQQVAQELLGKTGVAVTIAENGLIALQAVQGKTFDLILMDIQMPVMDGLTATKKIRQMGGKYRTLPIIAMTAHAMSGDREKSLAAGLNDHISKPIDPEVLYECLAQWIDPSKIEVSETDIFIDRSGDNEIGDGEWTTLVGKITSIDLDKGLKRLAGNQSLYIKLLRNFIRDYSDVMDRLQTLLANNDTESAIRIAHTAKGLSGTIGAIDLHQSFESLEEGIKQNRISLDTEFENSRREFIKVITQISEALPKKQDTKVTERVQVTPERIKTTILPTLNKLQHLITANDLASEDLFLTIKSDLYSLNPKESNQLDQALEALDYTEAATILDTMILKIKA